MRWLELEVYYNNKPTPLVIAADAIAGIAGPFEEVIASPDKGRRGEAKMVSHLMLKGGTSMPLLAVDTPDEILARAGAVLDEAGRALPWQVWGVHTDELGRITRMELRLVDRHGRTMGSMVLVPEQPEDAGGDTDGEEMENATATE
jgi:hypothetical protein